MRTQKEKKHSSLAHPDSYREVRAKRVKFFYKIEMNFVYILYSKSLDKYYIGEAIDLQERIKQHNSGFYETAYTKKAKDWILYYSIICNDRIQARRIETHIKKMKSKSYIQNLKKYPEITKKLKDKYN